MRPELRVVVRRVSHPTSDCLVERAIVQRLTPYGLWVDLDPDEAPTYADEADRAAAVYAARWAGRPAHGYAMWSRERGYEWVEAWAEGSRITKIPIGPAPASCGGGPATLPTE
jgi:hypothetical protein